MQAGYRVIAFNSSSIIAFYYYICDIKFHSFILLSPFQVLRVSGRPQWCRAIWGIVIVVLMFFTGYMVYKLLYDYFQYSSFNQSTTQWTKNVTLPAITICNENSLNYTKFKEDLADSPTLLEEFETLMVALEEYNGEGSGLDFIDKTAFTDFLNWEMKEGSLVLRFREHLYHTLVGVYDYKFRGIGYHIPQDHYNEYSQMTEMGECFELNDDASLMQSTGGVKGGLSIDLDANVNDYVFTTHTKGFLVFVRNHDETVMLNLGGYVAPPGSEVFIKLNAYHFTRLGPPHGTCDNVMSEFAKHSTHYETVRECIQRQKLDAMVDLCGCIPWYLAERLYTLDKTDILDKYMTHLGKEHALFRKKRSLRSRPYKRSGGAESAGQSTKTPLHQTKYSTHICGFVEQYSCEIVVEDAIRKHEVELKPCPEPCEYYDWLVESSSSVFPPSEEYFNRFLKNKVHKPTPPDFEYAKENMARVHIYYDQVKVEQMEQTKAYEPQNFIAEFGGTVDLFIGFSFFTVFQLIEISIAYCVSKVCFRKKTPAPYTTPTSNSRVVENSIRNGV